MATFKVTIEKIEIEEHPNADALELAKVGGYRAVVQRGIHQTGDLVAYIPEQAVLPDWLISKLNLEGKLAGSKKNRVKPVKLRGVLSQGLVYPLEKSTGERDYYLLETEDAVFEVKEGDDVTEVLGITKYEPPIPVHMAGEVFNAFGMTLKYDIENIKKYPNVLKEGEHVVITEKIHGTWCCLGYHPDAPHHIITSKGLSDKGLAFKLNEKNANNLYIRALNSTAPHQDGSGGTVLDRMHDVYGYDTPFYVLGEVFGKGVQDLEYGQDGIQFRVFDIYIGEPGSGVFKNMPEVVSFGHLFNFKTVPILYVGEYNTDVVHTLTEGNETVSGKGSNIREGVVIKPLIERQEPILGRVILKSVSEAYLTRKGGTEYN